MLEWRTREAAPIEQAKDVITVTPAVRLDPGLASQSDMMKQGLVIREWRAKLSYRDQLLIRHTE